MKTALYALILLTVPSTAYAHSGAVLKAAMNYLPMAMAFVSIFWTPIAKSLKRLRSLFKKEDE